MVNWEDPLLIIHDYFVAIKLQHTLSGLYIWEYVTSLDFEWSVLVGARPYRWTIWVYTLCRLSALVSVAAIIAGLDVSGAIHCRAWVICIYSFGYLALALASLIMLLRIHAIWERRVLPTAIAAIAWLVSIALNIRSLPVSHAYSVSFPTGFLFRVLAEDGLGDRDNSMGACVNTDVDRALPNAIGILVSDLVLLCVMLAGILRSKDVRMFGIRKLLFYQGVSWLAVAAIAEIPTIVFIILNLNDAWNMMFQPVELLLLTIGATRMYRGLMLYGSVTEVGVGSFPRSMGVHSSPVAAAARHSNAPASGLRFHVSDGSDGAYRVTGSLESQGTGVNDKV